MHFFFLALSYFRNVSRCTASGELIKQVSCESCFQSYRYRLQRRVIGNARGNPESDPAQAFVNAQHQLHVLLQTEIKPVPCPNCGWYQGNMIPQLRKQHLRFVWRTGLALLTMVPVLIFVVLLLLIFEVEIGPVARSPTTTRIIKFLMLGSLVLGTFLCVLKFLLSRIYDPNVHDAELRRELGRSLVCGEDALKESGNKSRS